MITMTAKEFAEAIIAAYEKGHATGEMSGRDQAEEEAYREGFEDGVEKEQAEVKRRRKKATAA